jgi:hypothetical protein
MTMRSPLKSRLEKSAHEEQISKKSLRMQLEKAKAEVLFSREEGTPFFSAMMTLFRSALLGSRRLFLSLSNLDMLIIKTIGRFIPFLGAGEILLLARRSNER